MFLVKPMYNILYAICKFLLKIVAGCAKNLLNGNKNLKPVTKSLPKSKAANKKPPTPSLQTTYPYLLH
jgi:hypothetical protein